MIEEIPDNGAILTVDTRGIVLTCNKQCMKMLGYAPEDMIGRSVSFLVPASADVGHPLKTLDGSLGLVCLGNFPCASSVPG